MASSKTYDCNPLNVLLDNRKHCVLINLVWISSHKMNPSLAKGGSWMYLGAKLQKLKGGISSWELVNFSGYTLCSLPNYSYISSWMSFSSFFTRNLKMFACWGFFKFCCFLANISNHRSSLGRLVWCLLQAVVRLIGTLIQ